jgi:hypothetical protein
MVTKIDNYIEIKQFLINEDWANFMITSQAFNKIYKYTRFILLNDTYSILYYKSEKFRNLVNSKIFNPNIQLGLNLNYLVLDDNESNTHISTNDNLEFYKLSLKYSNINDVSNLQNIQILDLTGCRYITDISPLKNIKEINLSYCENINDISNLKTATKIKLSNNNNITDISPLKNAKFVYIAYCNNITNIESLKNVDLLYLSVCSNLDVSQLYTVNYLYIFYCKNIKGLSELKEKKKLNLFILM